MQSGAVLIQTSRGWQGAIALLCRYPDQLYGDDTNIRKQVARLKMPGARYVHEFHGTRLVNFNGHLTLLSGREKESRWVQ